MTCFYQPRNRDCNLQLLPGASPLNLSAPLEPAITVSHATGALSKLFEHYTVESAMIISRFGEFWGMGGGWSEGRGGWVRGVVSGPESQWQPTPQVLCR